MADQLFIEDLQPGTERGLVRVITEADIEAFGALTGDRNPLHFDSDYAAATRFGGCIAHGMLSASLISTVLGMQLPGRGAVYLGQTIRFLAPVRAGDELRVTCTVREVFPERRRASVECVCAVGEQRVAEGEAQIMAASRAD